MLKRLLVPAIAVTALGMAALLVSGRAATAQSAADSSSFVDRGRYLVVDAGQCADCHRPGLVGGPNLIPGRRGVPWAKKVPSLRGLSMFPADADAIAFLQTAKLPDGAHALPPMPRYRFDEPDAQAIVAYLRSLH